MPLLLFSPFRTFFFFLAFSVPVCETTGQQFPPGGRPRRRTFENVLPGDKKIVFLVLCARGQACFFGGAAVEEAAVRTPPYLYQFRSSFQKRMLNEYLV